MRISRTQVALVSTGIAAVVAALFLLQAKSECLSPSRIKALPLGEYARKDIWDRLPSAKDWTEIHRRVTWHLDSVSLTSKGESIGNFGWHEGGPVCAQLRGGELWAKPFDSPPNPPERWEGPFIFLGENTNIDEAYFSKIFGNQCFQSDTGEQWCFGKGSITVDRKQYRAALHPDSSEMPNYGTPVSVKNEPSFWIFVPSGAGWLIFKDSFVTEEGHVKIEPDKSTPWRILKPSLPATQDG